MYTRHPVVRRRVAGQLREQVARACVPEHAARLAPLVSIAAVAFACVSCSLDSSPQTPQKTLSGQSAAGKGAFTPAERPGQLGSIDPDAGEPLDAAARRVTTGHDAPQNDKHDTHDEDAGSVTPGRGTSAMLDASTKAPEKDAGSAKDAGAAQDIPAAGRGTTNPTNAPTVDPECSRDSLRAKADAYLQAMANGDPSTLRVHPKLRFTENGRMEQLGAAVWLRHPKATFARHALDESRCSTITQAVLSSVAGRIVFGARLLYSDGQLLEDETQTVPENNATVIANIDAIPPVGSDPWNNEVPSDMRISRDKMTEMGQQYFDAATGGGMTPPASADCKRRQNGVLMANMGSCTVAPGTSRFQQRRFAVVDELLGIATATVLYENHLGFYLFKMADNKVQNIEVIGGATVTDSGW